MKLISKPHEIEGFRVQRGVKPPAWFLDAYKEGRISIHIDDFKGEYHVNIYTCPASHEKARLGDWVCLNSSGKIFKITHEERLDAYEQG